MLLIDTTVSPSGIHGLGCFTKVFVPKGTVVWRYDRRLDLSIRQSQVARFPEPIQTFLRFYGYSSRSWWTRYLVLCGDNSRYMNHSDDPNVVENRASRDIAAGEELTCDYRSFDLEAHLKLQSSAATG